MNRFLCIAAVAVIALLTGCAAPANNYQPKTTLISEPSLGSTVERQLGEELLNQGKYTEHDALRVQSPIKPHWAYTVYPGYFLKSGENEDGDFYRLGGIGEGAGYIDKSAVADAYKALLVRPDGVICVVTIVNAKACGNGARTDFIKTKRPVISVDSIQRTLIYNGKIGNKINIGYREFAGNMARPAFSNSIEYDLGESMEIGYKSARLLILEATNRSIRYKVLANFNEADR